MTSIPPGHEGESDKSMAAAKHEALAQASMTSQTTRHYLLPLMGGDERNLAQTLAPYLPWDWTCTMLKSLKQSLWPGNARPMIEKPANKAEVRQLLVLLHIALGHQGQRKGCSVKETRLLFAEDTGFCYTTATNWLRSWAKWLLSDDPNLKRLISGPLPPSKLVILDGYAKEEPKDESRLIQAAADSVGVDKLAYLLNKLQELYGVTEMEKVVPAARETLSDAEMQQQSQQRET